jgi:Ser/Thr protein kinase RdoA (MazF antagonist)
MDPLRVLQAYDVGAVLSAPAAAGGTAGRTWRIAAERGTFFLRLRGARTSSAARLSFDHGLRARLAARGVPTACAIPARNGEAWITFEGRVYELYPFIAGRAFDPANADDVPAAARALARFHQAAADYRPALPVERFGQFTMLGFSDALSDRLHDPRLLPPNLAGLACLAGSEPERRLLDRCIDRARRLLDTYAGEAYAGLTGWTIHGDFTPANLLYGDNGEVAGLFDFDWAMPGARCQDIADGLYFFAAAPRAIDGADIWSLTDAAELDLARCQAFLAAYHQAAPMSAAEFETLPPAMTAMWLAVRLEGMAKVPEADRWRFFSRDIEKPLEWIDTHWPELRRRWLARR